MEIYIFRHGVAHDGHPGSPDSARQLTDEGRKKTAAVAKAARLSGVSPSLILSSPYDRAVQTARIAADELKYKQEILKTRALVPESDPEAVWNEVREHRDEPAILLAGHEPLLSRVVAFLLGCPSLQVEMKKAAMVRIDIEEFRAAPRGVLRWMIVPALVS